MKVLEPTGHVHAFVCTRTKDGACCGLKGGAELRDRLKKWVKSEGLSKKVKVTASLCLGHCENGIAVVIYPEGKWLINVDAEADYATLQQEILSRLKADT